MLTPGVRFRILPFYKDYVHLFYSDFLDRKNYSNLFPDVNLMDYMEDRAQESMSNIIAKEKNKYQGLLTITVDDLSQLQKNIKNFDNYLKNFTNTFNTALDQQISSDFGIKNDIIKGFLSANLNQTTFGDMAGTGMLWINFMNEKYGENSPLSNYLRCVEALIKTRQNPAFDTNNDMILVATMLLRGMINNNTFRLKNVLSLSNGLFTFNKNFLNKIEKLYQLMQSEVIARASQEGITTKDGKWKNINQQVKQLSTRTKGFWSGNTAKEIGRETAQRLYAKSTTDFFNQTAAMFEKLNTNNKGVSIRFNTTKWRQTNNVTDNSSFRYSSKNWRVNYSESKNKIAVDIKTGYRGEGYLPKENTENNTSKYFKTIKINDTFTVDDIFSSYRMPDNEPYRILTLNTLGGATGSENYGWRNYLKTTKASMGYAYLMKTLNKENTSNPIFYMSKNGACYTLPLLLSKINEKTLTVNMDIPTNLNQRIPAEKKSILSTAMERSRILTLYLYNIQSKININL